MTSRIQEFESPDSHSLADRKPTGLRRTPDLINGDVDEKRREIALYFTTTFDTYTGLFDCLADDAGYFEKSIPLTLPINWESPWWPIVMGIEHERIHLETLVRSDPPA